MPARQPNILFIISDQHNPHVAGYAGDPKARTEHLDRLASEGTRFDCGILPVAAVRAEPDLAADGAVSPQVLGVGQCLDALP